MLDRDLQETKPEVSSVYKTRFDILSLKRKLLEDIAPQLPWNEGSYLIYWAVLCQFEGLLLLSWTKTRHQISCEMYGYSDFLLGSFSCQENKQIYAELSGQIICTKWQNLSAFFNQANAVPQKALKFSVDGRTMSFGTQGYFAHVTYRVENYFVIRDLMHLNFEMEDRQVFNL